LKAALFNAVLVGSGGFIGAMFRYGLSGLVQRNVPLSAFPYGTLAVNMLGCLLIGVGVGLVDARQLFGPDIRLFMLIGVLGGFTTYSTFGYETFALLRDGDFLRALANVGIHVVLGLALVWAGYAMTAR
jgi:CrcB protein